jgi:hypothetical protein
MVTIDDHGRQTTITPTLMDLILHLATIGVASISLALQVAAMRARGKLRPIENLRRKHDRKMEPRPPSLTQLP